MCFTNQLHKNVLVLNLSFKVKIPGHYQVLFNGRLSLPFCGQTVRTRSENLSSYEAGIYIFCISVSRGWSVNVLDECAVFLNLTAD